MLLFLLLLLVVLCRLFFSEAVPLFARYSLIHKWLFRVIRRIVHNMSWHEATNCALQTPLVSCHKSYVTEELLKAYVYELENAPDAIVIGSKTVELLSIIQIAT